MHPVVVITGANRGIGLELAKQYMAKGAVVFAAMRHPEEADELCKFQAAMGNHLHLLRVDVTDASSIAKAADYVAREAGAVDVLVNNAGTPGGAEPFIAVAPKAVEEVFRVNCLGPFQVTQRFVPLLAKAKGKVVMVTSLMGSISDNRMGGFYPYRLSKAALNMLGKNLALDLKGEGITVLILHPGWVRTRMGGEGAPLSVQASVSGMIRVIAQTDISRTGSFLAYDGRELPW